MMVNETLGLLQRAGLELMDMMAVYQEGAYERLCRWNFWFFFFLVGTASCLNFAEF